LNDDGIIVGESCNADGKTQATVWRVDLSGGTPALIGGAVLLPGLGLRSANTSPLSSAAGVSRTAPYIVSGAAVTNGLKREPVQWQIVVP